MTRTLTYLITENDLPTTLGHFLRRRGYSADLLTQLRLTSGVTADGVFRRMIDPLNMGERVQVVMPPDTPTLAPNPDLALTVLYEDDDILAVDKPDDMLVHPAGKGFDDAVGNFFVAHCPGLGFRPVGRLDRHTTGVCLIAKHQLAASLLNGNIDKDYYAVAEGLFPYDSGEINAPLLRVPGRVIKRAVDERGKPSITRYMVLERGKEHTFLRIRLVTGRTHQIRAHMSWLGHPLAGDSLYGGGTELIDRQALHCGCLRFLHPVTGREMEICSPLPEDMRKIFDI